jgi:hypothetical protein
LNQHRAVIPAVSSNGMRPLWSVMIPTYNCAEYLREALQSILSQAPDPERMQIEVIDDHSRDDPEAVVRELGAGRVGFFRQPRNLGHVANFNTCLQRSRGKLVHLLHGDDAVRDGFYRTMERPFILQPEIGAAFCRHIKIDERSVWRTLVRPHRDASGVVPDAAVWIAGRQPFQPPGAVIRRSVYEALGGFDSRITVSGEDWEMWVRIAATFPVWYEIEPLALYRVHGGSLTGSSIRSAANIRDVRRSVRLYAQYLPAPAAGQCSRAALELVATWALGVASQAARSGDTQAARAQFTEALRCSRSPATLRLAVRVLAQAAVESIRRRRRSRHQTASASREEPNLPVSGLADEPGGGHSNPPRS